MYSREIPCVCRPHDIVQVIVGTTVPFQRRTDGGEHDGYTGGHAATSHMHAWHSNDEQHHNKTRQEYGHGHDDRDMDITGTSNHDVEATRLTSTCA